MSRLSHINPAVIVSAIKVILKFTLKIENQAILEGICKKISTPLISLISKDECTWILLKNISVLIDKFPSIFQDVRVFFVKYTDPSYIKKEKLSIIKKLANHQNFKIIVNELIEYSYDLELSFSRQALKNIWELGLKFPKYSDISITALTSVLKTISQNSFANHLLNELVIGINFIYKKYQKRASLNSSVVSISLNYERVNEKDSLIALMELVYEFIEVVETKSDILKFTL